MNILAFVFVYIIALLVILAFNHGRQRKPVNLGKGKEEENKK